MKEYKILLTGSMGAGKTAAIAALSEIEPLNTEVPASELTRPDKTTTTVGLDYGEITISDDCKLRLFGTPGQGRFRFLWEILSEGVLGVLIFVDHAQDDPAADLERFLEEFAGTLERAPGAIGITHVDVKPEIGFDAYFRVLAERNLDLPLMPIDAREREDVLALVDAALSMAEAEIYMDALLEAEAR